MPFSDSLTLYTMALTREVYKSFRFSLESQDRVPEQSSTENIPCTATGGPMPRGVTVL